MAKKWLVMHVRGARLCAKPLNEHNRMLVKTLFNGHHFQTDMTGTEHYALQRYPKQKEIEGLDFDEEHEPELIPGFDGQVPQDLQHLVYDGCGNPSGDELKGSVRPTQNDDGPAPGTYAYTARLMAEIMPVDDDPDFWDRWKDEQKDRDL